MTLDSVLACLRARWVVVLVATLLGVGVGGVLASQADRVYEATTAVLLRPASAPSDGADNVHARYAEVRANQYGMLVHRREVLEAAAESLGGELTFRQLRSRVSAHTPLDSPLILVRARSADPESAARISTAVATSLSGAVERAEAVGPDESVQLEAPIAVEAVPPKAPILPQVRLFLAAGLVVGAAVGVCGALAASVWREGRVVGPPARRLLLAPTADVFGRLRRGVGSFSVPRALTGAHVAWALMVAASIPWRVGVYYEGGVDPVVLGKAVLAVAALATAWLLARNAEQRHPVAALPVLLMSGYLAVTVVGGLANDEFVASAVVATRVAILLLAACLLVRRYGVVRATQSLIHVLAVLAICGAVTGLATFSGRLAGGIPALHPNALASMTALVCVWLLAKVFTAQDTTADLVLVAACVTIILLTGSRTSLAAFLLAVIIMLSRMTRVRPASFLALVVSAPAVVYLIFGTDLLESILLRGGSQEVLTLSNRLIAWEAAFGTVRDGWQTWFGQGLAYKHVQVSGQWWDTQLLDSSWISAWVQGGILGFVLVALLTIVTLLRAAFRRRADGPVWLGLIVLAGAMGFLESGLFDASVPFLLLFMTALGAGLPSRGSAPVLPEASGREEFRHALPAGSLV